METLSQLLKQSNPFLLETDVLNHKIDETCLNAPLQLSVENHMMHHESLFPAPAIGVIVFIFVATVLLLLIQFVLLPSTRRKRGYLNLLLRHAIVTGGSSGIGLSIAKELVKRQCACITLIARGEAKLKEAEESLTAFAREMKSCSIISIYPVDVSDDTAMRKCAEEICSKSGPPTLLMNVAGTSIAKDFIKTNPGEFQRLMSINYLGSVYTTQAFLPFMMGSKTGIKKKKEEEEGANQIPKTIVFTSSAAGQVGVYGYSAYSPTKYALRGLAEVLQMELLRENIFVQVAYPPDTDTPGYQLEQLDKPKETQLISESAGLFKAESVAKGMVSAALAARPPFSVVFGIEGWLLGILSTGMSPVHGLLDAVAQILFMGLFRFISLFFLMDFRRIVTKIGKNK